LWHTIVGEVSRDEPWGSVALWGRWLLGVVCAAALALIGFKLVPHGNPGGAPAAMPSASTNAAEAWLAANLARTTPIQTDVDVVLDLSSVGFSDVSTWTAGLPGQPGALPGVGYLVVTAPIRAAVGAAVARQDRVSMLPVAVFGSGPTRVQVCQIEPEPAATLAARLSGLAHDETAAEAALLSNPRVHVAPAARRVLATRALDMRAATVIAQLAANTKVSIDAINQAPAEAAAGRPARALTVSVGQPAVLSDTLRMLPAVYAPLTVATRANGQTRIDWPIGLAPAGGFG
jgi:pyruvate/2-oxoglutarate dehydrogenase complex dihydrolipoamide acyltransferase (E2) component